MLEARGHKPFHLNHKTPCDLPSSHQLLLSLSSKLSDYGSFALFFTNKVIDHSKQYIFIFDEQSLLDPYWHTNISADTDDNH